MTPVLRMVLLAAGILLVHLFKSIRFYLVLLEQRPFHGSFPLLYLRTTVINLVVPFKLGEIYRIFTVTRLTKCLEVGALSVVLDRFFDTFVLLIFLLPYDLLTGRTVRSITLLLLIFLCAVVFVYKMFMPTYTYLNRYMIKNSGSKRGIYILGLLENVRTWYNYTVDLISGRQYLIVLCSVLGWGAEFILLSAIAAQNGIEFGLEGFSSYIGSIFSTEKSSLLTIYTRYSLIVLAAAFVIVAIAGLVRKHIHEEKSNRSV